MPTFAAMAGTAPPKDIDGLNLLPYLRGENQSKPHGDLYWKLNGQRAIVRDQWKAIRFDAKPREPELYNLSKDIGEKINIAREHPEMLDALNKAWDEWNATLPTAYVDPKPVPDKPAGKN